MIANNQNGNANNLNTVPSLATAKIVDYASSEDTASSTLPTSTSGIVSDDNNINDILSTYKKKGGGNHEQIFLLLNKYFSGWGGAF